MTTPRAPSRWPDGVRADAVVIACTSSGFWLRARVLGLGSSEARVRFDERTPWPGSWLPTLGGFGEREATVTPELVAALPDTPPTRLPRVGAPVLVLWDEKRMHPATLVRRTSERSGVVRHDEGDEETVTPERVLVRGEIEDGALVRAAGAGVGLGASVTVDRGDGWVSMVGSRGVYVRFPKASHGVWVPLGAARPGGSARPPRRPASAGELAVGARVSARWVDRAWYPATVRAVRGGGAEAEVTWDDGTRGWISSERLVVTTPAPDRVPQERVTRVRGPQEWGREGSVAVLARSASGDWARARTIATRGGDVLCQIDRGGEKLWARGGGLATPVGGPSLPAAGTAVVVETRAGRSKKRFVYATGRALGAKGDRLEVRLDDGRTTTAPASALFVRLPAPLPVRARVVALRPAEGVARVEATTGTKWARTVDLARVRPAPAAPSQPAPPPSPPPGPTPEAGRAADALDSEAERAAARLREIRERWSGALGGYREAPSSSDRACSLEVEVGELTLELRWEPPHFAVTLVAARRVEHAPPVDGVSVRLAHWLHARLVTRALDPREVERADLEWAATFLPTDARRRITRAGGALCLTVRCRELPAAAEVVSWARAAHGRQFDTEAVHPPG